MIIGRFQTNFQADVPFNSIYGLCCWSSCSLCWSFRHSATSSILYLLATHWFWTTYLFLDPFVASKYMYCGFHPPCLVSVVSCCPDSRSKQPTVSDVGGWLWSSTVEEVIDTRFLLCLVLLVAAARHLAGCKPRFASCFYHHHHIASAFFMMILAR